MTETIDYYMKKSEAMIKASKDRGCTNLELASRLGCHQASFDKLKPYLKDNDAIFYDRRDRRWRYTG